MQNWAWAWLVMRISRPKAIVLDLEGTITDANFSIRLLYPFLRGNVLRFLKDTYRLESTQLMIDKLRTVQVQLRNANTRPVWKRHKAIPKRGDADMSQVTEATLEFVLFLYEFYPYQIELFELQLLTWIWAADHRLLQGHVYDEVANCMHIWHYKNKIKIFIFSSALALVQQLLLCRCTSGNLLSLIDGFFDFQLGSKLNPASYTTLVECLKLPPEKVLYITDSVPEGQCALNAGLKVAIIQRDQTQEKKPKILTASLKKMNFIRSFEDVIFKT